MDYFLRHYFFGGGNVMCCNEKGNSHLSIHNGLCDIFAPWLLAVLQFCYCLNANFEFPVEDLIVCWI